jgi:cytoskeleton protein RodZ
MAYDLASRQSRISFAVQRKRETGLPSFGEKLKLEREKRKITLEEISVSTKIGTRMLQALEEDKFNQLPGGIFNKGFVRAYARFVGLDEDQTVANYLEASGDAPPVSTEIAPREDGAHEDAEHVRRLEASADDPSRPLPWGLFAAILLVVALALSFWSHRQREHARQSVQPPPTSAPQPVSAPVSGPVSGEDRSTGSPDSSSPSSSSPSSSSPTAGEVPSSAAPKTPQALATATPAPSPGEFTVLIQAREESWISITADGKTISSELLPAGSERTIRGRKEITVKAGNAGGVDFRFNGKKLDFGGEFGEVKIVTFGPRGMLPAAPSLPATP